MSKFKKILIIGISTSLVSEVYLNFFISDFRISFSVIIFSIFLLFYKLNIIHTSIVTGVIVFVFRSFLNYLSIDNIGNVIRINYPVIFFYVIYGIIYHFINVRKKETKLFNMFLKLCVCDFIANLIEILLRIKNMSDMHIFTILKTLLIIAIIRSSIIVIVINLLRYYKLLIVKKEHERRYRRLILLVSNLKNEVYFMKKNISYIENVMKNSYELYEQISNEEPLNHLKDISLSIAKDVHEIKKDYMRVVVGIEEIYANKLEYTSMSLKDIFTILEQTTLNILKSKDKNIELIFQFENNFKTEKHYALISVLRNLINNSIEAIDVKKGRGLIKITQYEKDNSYVFEVSDTGKGIESVNKDVIFEAGYSTKFDENTGDVYRGLGLTFVNNIVYDYFEGSIELNSKENKGTSFKIVVSKEILEEVKE